MTPERWQQIEEIFQDASDLPKSEREKFVAERCSNDVGLRAEVEKLLSQLEDAGSFIETPALSDEEVGVLSSLMKPDEDDPMLGNLLGSYRIEREIGRGGMGAVYEAVRADGEFRRKVAVKIVKRGMDTDFILRRFRNERQILATLEHPYITRLMDGGTTDDGRPYFVMDYIEGLQLYRYCDKNRLTIEERLRMFAKVCEAVEYAHKNLVIHRDLKPSNILIAADGTPRLLDFGIAKLLNPEMASDTLQPTATAMRMMTIDYASPEQINGEKVTFSTDTYSLGVILYELLTGHRPYRFINRLPHEMARVICEEPPILPSDAITTSEETLPIVDLDKEALTIRHLADLRKNSPDRLREMLRGNLDNITLKALCKLPDDRYESVQDFREDIEKHLDGKPVSTPFYFPIHKVGTIQAQANTKLIAVLPLKLLNFSATENTDENYLSIGLADAIISRLTSVRDFTVRPTSSISSYEKGDVEPLQAGRELGVDFVLEGRIKKSGQMLRVSLQMLDVRREATTWAGQFDEKFSDVLALEDAISNQVADALVSQNIGDNEVKLGKRGTDSPEAYDAYLRGRYFWNQFTPETFPKALDAFEKAVQLDPNYALAHVGVADYYNWATIFGIYTPLDGYQKTREAALRALEINPQLSEAISVLAFITAFSDYNWTEAEELFKQSLELNPNYGLTHEWYAALLAGTGREEEAYTEIMRSQALDRLSLRVVTLTAWTLYQLRRYPEALARVEELLEMNPNYYQGFFQLGNILREMGRAEEAVAAGRKGMMLSPGLGYMHYELCFALASLNRLDEAWEVLREYERNSPVSEINSYHLGMCYAAVGDRETAFNWLNKAVDDRHPWVVWLATEAKLSDLRADERFNELLRKTNRHHLIRQSGAVQQSLAILPFKINTLGTSGDTEERFLGLGLSDALITRLSKAPKLVVRPASSVLRFSESADAFEAGKELAVRSVLDGNIRRIGERVRVWVQLLDIKEDSTVWAENFDEEFTNVLELEDRISERVVRALLPHLTGEEQIQISRRGTDNPQAYEAYLKGRFYWNLQTQESFTRSIEYYQAAVSLDPDYAQAYAAIAEYYMLLGTYCVTPFAQAAQMAKEAAEKAVKIAPSLAEGYAALGFVSSCFDQDWIKAEELLLHALNLNSNSTTANFWYVALLAQLKRFDEALARLKNVLELEPASPVATHMMAWVLYHARRFEESIDIHEKTLEFTPNYAWGHQTFSWALRRAGRFEEAVKEAEKAVQIAGDDPFYLSGLAMAQADAGNRTEAEKILHRLDEISETRFVSDYMLALVHCALRDKEKAIAYLKQSVESRDAWSNWLGVEPQFDILRNDSRFDELLRRTNNPIADTDISDKQTVKSIAVLPLKLFTSPTDSNEDRYLSIGLTDALIVRLSKVGRLKVRPTSSVLSLQGEATDVISAGKTLQVEYVIDGSIRRAGARVRVSLQLLKVANGSTVWGGNFDENITDVLELEDVISERVVKALLPQLTGEEQRRLGRRGTNNVEAYQAYLRGRYHLFSFTPDDFTKAVSFFEKAIELDRDYALAYSALSDVYFTLTGFASKTPAESFPLIEKFAQKAIDLDDRLGEAYANLGMVKSYDVDLETGGELLKRGLELNPNQLNGYIWHSVFLTLQGRSNEAIAQARKAYELDPTSGFHQYHYIWTLYQNRRFDQAVELIEQKRNIAPNFAHGNAVAGWIFRHLNEEDKALEHCEKAHQLSPETGWITANLAATYARFGNKKKASLLLRQIEAERKQYVSPYCLAQVFLHLGEKEKTFEMLERSFADKDVWYPWIANDPGLDALRTEPRFRSLIEKMNPSSKSEETIHQSQVPTKLFSAAELQGTNSVKNGESLEVNTTFLYRHRYKLIIAGILAIVFAIGMATGVINVDLKDTRFEIENSK